MSLVPSQSTTPIARIRGDSASIALSLIDPDSGAAFDPTGSTLIFTLKNSAWDDDSAAVLQKISTVGGFTIVNAAAGAVNVLLVPNDYNSLSPGRAYRGDVQAQNTSTGAVKTVWLGRFIAENDVTKGTTVSIPVYLAQPALFGFAAWRPDLIGPSGGAGYLDGVVTVGLSLPVAFTTYFGSQIGIWVLEAGTTATGNGVVRPLDYNASTNAVQWTEKL